MILENKITIQPRGLKNLGNTCFLNSVLQAISSCPSLIEYLQVIAGSNHKYMFSTQLLKCIQELRQKTKSYFPLNSSNILNALINNNPSFKGYDEQDALEAFETIMSLLKDEKIELLKSTQSTNHLSINEKLEQFKSLSLEGLTGSHIQCKECLENYEVISDKYNPVRHQIFITLPLPIPLSLRVSSNNNNICTSLGRRTTSYHSAITSYYNTLNLKGGHMDANHKMLPNNNNNIIMNNTNGRFVNKNNSIYNCIEEYFKSESLSNVLCNSCSHTKTMSVLKHKQSLYSETTTVYDKSDNNLVGENNNTYNNDDDEDCNTDINILQLLINTSQSMSIIGVTDCLIQDIPENINQHTTTINNNTIVSNNMHNNHQDEIDMMWLAAIQNVYCDALRHSSISRLPKLLCLYICRRTYDELTGKIRKLRTNIDFPLKLNLQNFLSVDTNFNYSSVENHHHSLIDYSLKSIIVHTGNADAGKIRFISHYVAYCLINNKPTRQWCYFSDESYKLVSESEVLKVQATMLFYDSIAH